jgi:plastocyanin
MTMTTWRRARRVGLELLACAALVTCAGGPATPDYPTLVNHVNVVDNRYLPDSITINAGETVTFDWKGFNSHTVTFDAAFLPTSPEQTTGEFEVTFPGGGTFTYYCKVHGRFVMSGKVVVMPGGPTEQ